MSDANRFHLILIFLLLHFSFLNRWFFHFNSNIFHKYYQKRKLYFLVNSIVAHKLHILHMFMYIENKPKLHSRGNTDHMRKTNGNRPMTTILHTYEMISIVHVDSYVDMFQVVNNVFRDKMTNF